MRESFMEFIETVLKPGFLIIACGLPATGKTVACHAIARARGCRLLRSDLIRQEVLKGEDIFDEKVAADMAKRMLVYDEMFRQADEALAQKKCLILDATFATGTLKLKAAAIAAKHKTRFIIIQTECPPEVAIGRLTNRTRENYESNALTEHAYRMVEKSFEAVGLDAIKRAYPGLDTLHLVVDTTSDKLDEWRIVKEEK